MKSVICSSPGLNNLCFSDIPQPAPVARQVRVKLKAASLNHRDLLNIEADRPGFEWDEKSGAFTPGSDGCGVIDKLGPDVKYWRLHERVTPLFFQNWPGGRRPPDAAPLGKPGPGTLQEYICIDERDVAAPPAFLTDMEAATLPCAALTAWNALTSSKVKAGDAVLILGSGGVSVFALQFAKCMGAEIVAISGADDKLERLGALGAHHLINYKKTPEWGAAAYQKTGGVHCIADVIGAMDENAAALRQGGIIASIGTLAARPLQTGAAIPRNAGAIIRISVGSREQFSDMCRAIEVNRVRPIISAEYPLDRIVDAFASMHGHEHFGKVCVAVS